MHLYAELHLCIWLSTSSELTERRTMNAILSFQPCSMNKRTYGKEELRAVDISDRIERKVRKQGQNTMERTMAVGNLA